MTEDSEIIEEDIEVIHPDRVVESYDTDDCDEEDDWEEDDWDEDDWDDDCDYCDCKCCPNHPSNN